MYYFSFIKIRSYEYKWQSYCLRSCTEFIYCITYLLHLQNLKCIYLYLIKALSN